MKEQFVRDLNDLALFGAKPVLILGHFENNYVFKNGECSSINGIPRVMRQMIRALNLKGIPSVVTAFDADSATAYGFYASACAAPELVGIMPLPRLKKGLFHSGGFFAPDRLWDACIAALIGSSSKPASLLADVLRRRQRVDNPGTFVKLGLGLFDYILSLPKALKSIFERLKRIEKMVHAPDRWRYVLVPHYFLFPEALDLDIPLLLYLPDYIPHFYAGRNLFPDEAKHSETGRRLSRRARIVLTNSRFSGEYLPDTDLQVPREKIISFVLPNLSGEHSEKDPEALDEQVLREAAGKSFIFYPTQPNPNKRLDLLIRAWRLAQRKLDKPELYLVLTSTLVPEPLLDDIKDFGMMDRLLVFPRINDATLSWLYQHAVCLGFSSEMEGNFPTQVLEALINNCPIVCMEHPLIQSELGEDSLLLLSAPLSDMEKFSELILFAMNHRDKVLLQQEILKQKVLKRFEFGAFAEEVSKLDDVMCSANHVSGDNE